MKTFTNIRISPKMLAVPRGLEDVPNCRDADTCGVSCANDAQASEREAAGTAPRTPRSARHKGDAMFTQSSTLELRRTWRTAVLAVLAAAVALIALGRPSLAAATPPGFHRHIGAAPMRITSVATVRHHALGELIAKKQVHVRLPSRKLLATLPASVDLTANDVPVANQGHVGSCVTWATDYALLGWYERSLGVQTHLLNPMYTYSQVHLNNSTDPTKGYGGGSYPATVLSYLQTQGNDTMAHYSHNAWDWQDTPNTAEYNSAANYKIAGYNSVLPNYSIDGATRASLIKGALASGKPVAIGFTVRNGFFNLTPTNYVDNDTTSAAAGGHEVLAVAYDQNGLWIQNSWGTDWGYNGYAYLSWNVVQQDVNSAYTITGLAAGADPAQIDVNEKFALQQASTSAAPVTFSWTVSDPSVVGYWVYLKTDNGSFALMNSTLQTASQSTFQLAFGHTYQVMVLAVDKLCDSQTNTCGTDWNGYLYSATLTPSISDDQSFTIASPWSRYSLTGTLGGTYVAAAQAGATLTTSFTGRDVGLVAPTFSTAGQATVTCDGTSPFTVNLNSASTTTGKVMAWCHWAQSGQHSMKIVVAGTTNTPWVGVDAFTYLQ